MSRLTDLKTELRGVSSDAKQVAGNLGQFKQKFQSHSAKVNGLIGDTATNADKQIIAVLQDAAKAVDNAAASLHAAAKACADYADQA